MLLEVLLDDPADPDEVEPDEPLLEVDSLLGDVDGADEPLEPLLPEPDSLRLSVR